jgi:hypothetical protein
MWHSRSDAPPREVSCLLASRDDDGFWFIRGLAAWNGDRWIDEVTGSELSGLVCWATEQDVLKGAADALQLQVPGAADSGEAGVGDIPGVGAGMAAERGSAGLPVGQRDEDNLLACLAVVLVKKCGGEEYLTQEDFGAAARAHPAGALELTPNFPTRGTIRLRIKDVEEH